MQCVRKYPADNDFMLAFCKHFVWLHNNPQCAATTSRQGKALNYLKSQVQIPATCGGYIRK